MATAKEQAVTFKKARYMIADVLDADVAYRRRFSDAGIERLNKAEIALIEAILHRSLTAEELAVIRAS